MLIRLAAIAGASALLIAGGWLAWLQMAWVEELQPGYFDMPRVGPPRLRKDDLLGQIARVKQFRRARALNVITRGGVLTACGVLLPSLVLALAAIHYSWFFAGGHAIIQPSPEGILRPIEVPNLIQLTLLLTSLFSPVDLTTLDYNHHALPVSLAFGAYKFFISGWVVFVLGKFIVKAIWALAFMSRKEEELAEALKTFVGVE